MLSHLSPLPLLSAFPLLRSRNVQETCARMGQVFSPHTLELCSAQQQLDVMHNQVRLRDLSLNVLRYGAQVLIDPGERGDFYLVQLPLSGSAQLACGGEQARVDHQVLSVLQPQERSLMRWSSDCAMLLLQAPRQVVQARAQAWGMQQAPSFALTHSRADPSVAAWWQAVLDMTANLDRFGAQWLAHPAAYTALEEFLLTAFTSLLAAPQSAELRPSAGDARCLSLAKEYIHAHLDKALAAADIARHACVSVRTLENVFKRSGAEPPLAYARNHRLQAVHEVLQQARHQGQPVRVTDVALNHGFVHMGRFAAQYRARYGVSPSGVA